MLYDFAFYNKSVIGHNYLWNGEVDTFKVVTYRVVPEDKIHGLNSI